MICLSLFVTFDTEGGGILFAGTIYNGNLVKFNELVGVGAARGIALYDNGCIGTTGSSISIYTTNISKYVSGGSLTNVISVSVDLAPNATNKYQKYINNKSYSITETEYNSILDQYKKASYQAYPVPMQYTINGIVYETHFDYYEAYYVSDSSKTEVTISNTVKGVPVKSIGKHLLIDSSATTLNLPSNIETFYYYGLNGEHLISINVDANNPWYASKDGVMYSKDMSEIFKFPTGKDVSSYVFPESVSSIGRFAFAWCNGIKKIELPETISIIDDHAFYCCPNLSSITIKNKNCDIYDDWDELTGSTICNSYNSSTNTYNYLGVICGYNNSSAQNYAENFDRTFVSLGDDPAITTTTTTSTTTTTTTTTSTTTTTTTLETTTTTSAPTTTTSAQTMPSQPNTFNLGDANEDNKVDAKDASFILIAYAKASTGSDDGLTEQQRADADVNSDGKVDSKDASTILSYYSYISTGGKNDLETFLKS